MIDRWEGEGVNEVGKDKKTGAVRVKVNPKFFRPTEVVSTLNTFCPVCQHAKCTQFPIR